MMNRYREMMFVTILAMTYWGCGFGQSDTQLISTTYSGPSEKPHVVFVTGDEEYRSEESMPMLARILVNRFNFDATIVYAINDGEIDPNRLDNIPGLEILEEADLMVLFTRFRKLPDHQLRYILRYAESGKPMVGFRTATHAFSYGEDHPNHYLDFEWPQRVLGLPWISHHGHESSTEVTPSAERPDHPVLNGVTQFHARSWLYHSTTLLDDALPILKGRAVEGEKAGGAYFGDPHTAAWAIETDRGEKDVGRVFFTTLGHPYDFFDESMRRVSIQGIFWALGQENSIPNEGLNVEIIGEFDPNPAGFGEQFKKGLRPQDITLN